MPEARVLGGPYIPAPAPEASRQSQPSISALDDNKVPPPALSTAHHLYFSLASLRSGCLCVCERWGQGDRIVFKILDMVEAGRRLMWEKGLSLK